MFQLQSIINAVIGQIEDEMPIDRLSELPDSILIHILSFLSKQEAGRTVVLSTRWQFVWPYRPKLVFREETSSRCRSTREFVDRVHRTLAVCCGNHLSALEFDFESYRKCFASDVDRWVEFAAGNEANWIALRLNSSEEGDLYELPQVMYCNPSLAFLSVKGCVLGPRRTIEWGSLKTLVLNAVELGPNVMEKILSSCPVLHFLGIINCRVFDALEIRSLSLRTLCLRIRVLTVSNQNDENSGDSLVEISTPHLRYLGISLDPEGGMSRLTNVSSVVRATVDYTGVHYDPSSVKVMSNTGELFKSLQHVKNFILGIGCIKVLSMLAGKGWRLPQLQVKKLTVIAPIDEQNIRGVVVLLESSPNLETLNIDWKSDRNEAPSTFNPAASHLMMCDLNGDLLHLKTVSIKIPSGHDLSSEAMLKLVEVLLKRATMLEKMAIDVGDLATFSSAHASKYIKITRALISYPRSSQKAVIQFQQDSFCHPGNCGAVSFVLRYNRYFLIFLLGFWLLLAIFSIM